MTDLGQIWPTSCFCKVVSEHNPNHSSTCHLRLLLRSKVTVEELQQGPCSSQNLKYFSIRPFPPLLTPALCCADPVNTYIVVITKINISVQQSPEEHVAYTHPVRGSNNCLVGLRCKLKISSFSQQPAYR